MADGVNSYLLFFSAGSQFLLPLSCVKRVTDMKEREPEMALADFLELPEAGNLSDQAYLIIADCGDREIGIRAEVVTGLVQVEEEQIYAIPEAVRSSRNQYMDRMAALDAEEEKGKLAFIVVPSLLIPRPVL